MKHGKEVSHNRVKHVGFSNPEWPNKKVARLLRLLALKMDTGDIAKTLECSVAALETKVKRMGMKWIPPKRKFNFQKFYIAAPRNIDMRHIPEHGDGEQVHYD